MDIIFRIRSAGGARTSAIASSSSSSWSASSSPTPRTRPSWCYTCRQASKGVFEWEMFALLFSLKNIDSTNIFRRKKWQPNWFFSIFLRKKLLKSSACFSCLTYICSNKFETKSFLSRQLPMPPGPFPIRPGPISRQSDLGWDSGEDGPKGRKVQAVRRRFRERKMFKMQKNNAFMHNCIVASFSTFKTT